MRKSNVICIGGIKIIIGLNCLDELNKEILLKSCQKPMVVTDKGIARAGLLEQALSSIQNTELDYVMFDEVLSDPSDAIVRRGTTVFLQNQCDSIIAVGGGSVIDCAKAINLMSTNEGSILDYATGKVFKNEGHPLFSIPTTSGTGSEVTQYAVITDEKESKKYGIGDSKLTSKVVFLSPLMTIGLPPKITAATGIDALTHGIEAYTTNRVLNAVGSTIISDTLAIKGIEMISQNLVKAYINGENIEARKNVMVGCTLTGLVTQAGSGSAHGIASALGSTYHVPHGNSVGVVLPYVMKHSLAACPERYRDIAIAMGRNVDGLNLMDSAYEAVQAVCELLSLLEFPTLKTYIPSSSDLEDFAQEAMKDHCCDLNAKVFSLEEMKSILNEAWNKESYCLDKID